MCILLFAQQTTGQIVNVNSMPFSQKYYLKNRDSILAKSREYNERHRKELAIYHRKYYLEHKGPIQTRSAEYREKHKDDKRKYSTKYRAEHRNMINNNNSKWQKEASVRNKLEVLSYYSPGGKLKCSWPGCDINDTDMLTLDHINNDGAEQRRNGLGKGRALYASLRKLGFPAGYQTLCSNHNLKKEMIHKRSKVG